MKTKNSVGAAAIARVIESLEPLAASVIPIFMVGGAGQPVAFGSAILIELGARRFLITARHVVDEHRKSTIYVDGKAGLSAVKGDFYCTPEAEHDVAVLQLDSELREELAKHLYLSEADLLPAHDYEDRNYLALVGYPASRSKEKRQIRRVRTQGYIVGVRILSVAGALIRGSFRKMRNRNTQSTFKVAAPDLYGMSGGAMFASKVSLQGHCTKLAGISTTWLKNRNEVVGTKIAIALAIIRDVHGVDVPVALAPAELKSTLPPAEPSEGRPAASKAWSADPRNMLPNEAPPLVQFISIRLFARVLG